MKKVVIGRGRECNVVLADTTDVVSRRQAVITFTFFGKMTLYDTSSNGTFVNGERLAKQEGKVVTRNDKINFAHVWDLDWATVKDPYRGTKIALASGIVALLLVIGGLFLLLPDGKGGEPEKNGLAADTLQTDTLRRDTDTAEPMPSVAEPPMQTEIRGNATKKRPRSKRSGGYDVADSAYVEDDYAVDSVASYKSNAAPLIYQATPEKAKRNGNTPSGTPESAKTFVERLSGTPESAKTFVGILSGTPERAKAVVGRLSGTLERAKTFVRRLSGNHRM